MPTGAIAAGLPMLLPLGAAFSPSTPAAEAALPPAAAVYRLSNSIGSKLWSGLLRPCRAALCMNMFLILMSVWDESRRLNLLELMRDREVCEVLKAGAMDPATKWRSVEWLFCCDAPTIWYFLAATGLFDEFFRP